MNEPVLVIMAAGIGSRFGGLKQLAPVGKNGEPIIKFSLYDAINAGFKKAVLIIKKETLGDFRKLIDEKIEKLIKLEYVYQELDMLPPGYKIPEGRVKPWGTGHAILCAKNVISEPFAVINADDFYGRDAFHVIYNHLLHQKDDSIYRFSMVGYSIENTLTDNGHVARGICRTEGNYLTGIDERLRIEKHADHIEYTENEGITWNKVEQGTIVSMNLWGFSKNMMLELNSRFSDFLDTAITENALRAEYLLPAVVNDLLKQRKAVVKVLHSKDRWYGVTYKEDLSSVTSAIQTMQDNGAYPESLF